MDVNISEREKTVHSSSSSAGRQAGKNLKLGLSHCRGVAVRVFYFWQSGFRSIAIMACMRLILAVNLMLNLHPIRVLHKAIRIALNV